MKEVEIDCIRSKTAKRKTNLGLSWHVRGILIYHYHNPNPFMLMGWFCSFFCTFLEMPEIDVFSLNKLSLTHIVWDRADTRPPCAVHRQTPSPASTQPWWPTRAPTPETRAPGRAPLAAGMRRDTPPLPPPPPFGWRPDRRWGWRAGRRSRSPRLWCCCRCRSAWSGCQMWRIAVWPGTGTGQGAWIEERKRWCCLSTKVDAEFGYIRIISPLNHVLMPYVALAFFFFL